MADTNIDWADKTWNPVTGCAPVSAGCKNCYAKRMANRLRGRCGYPAENPFAVTLHHERLNEPLRWKKPQRIFVCSMGDIFHEDVPCVFLDKIFQTVYRANQHVFMVLTKRPRVMFSYLRDFQNITPNLWVGVSVEDQKTADERIPLLLRTPAAKRFVSYEPALGPVDFTDIITSTPEEQIGEDHLDSLDHYEAEEYRDAGYPDSNALDWVIMGGETGPGARPRHPDWARSVRDQCKAAGVPFFFKGWGDWLHRSTPNVLYFIVNYSGAFYKGVEKTSDEISMYRVGKKAAGCLLDGVEHKAVPK